MKAIPAALACCLIAVSSLSAAIYVPSDQPTIQAGINVANPGDTVYVLPGIYTGDGNRDLTFGGKNITLLSTTGPGATIIDCEGSAADPHIGIFLDNGEDSTAWIEGFTITRRRCRRLHRRHLRPSRRRLGPRLHYHRQRHTGHNFVELQHPRPDTELQHFR